MTLQRLARAELLLDARRYADAEAALRETLAAAPNDAMAHNFLAFALYHQERYLEALEEAKTAIGLAPAEAAHHYVQALALLALEREGRALRATREALRLNPAKPAYHALLSRIYLRRKDWTQALRAAEAGLQLNPEHDGCTNLRALALVKLGRRDEAGEAIAAALARDPENALTHANQGWALLHQGRAEAAQHHFREALRLDPMSDWARRGIVEALKARHPVYRWMLRYFLWMSRLTTEEQWGVVAALSGVRRALRVIARQVPILYVIVLPLMLLYATFSFLTWTARPLFALFLRLDRFGRLALPREEIVASNWVGACLLTAVLGVGLAAITGVASLLWGFPLLAPGFLVLALLAFAMLVPVAGVFRAPRGVGRTILAVYSALLTLVGLLGVLLTLVSPTWGLALTGVLAVVFLSGWVLYSWVAALVITLAS